MEKLIVQNNILINANLSKVWDALVNPEQTKQYMFGCKTVSDFKIGSPLLWQANYEEKDVIFVKGIILDIEPNRLLKYTVIDPNASMADSPENYLNVTYQLEQQNGLTNLTVFQDGIEGAADGDKRFKDIQNNGEGWNPILVAIKKLVESK